MEIFSFINPSLDNGKMSRNLRKSESQERERVGHASIPFNDSKLCRIGLYNVLRAHARNLKTTIGKGKI